jgi:light-regulated signal transduction histidine kinase (bacteriophytochrome)
MSDVVHLLAKEPITLTNCEREPIHTPGTLQPGGILLACGADGCVTHASGQQLARTELIGTVEGALLAAGLPPAALVLELTESVLM